MYVALDWPVLIIFYGFCFEESNWKVAGLVGKSIH